MVDLYAEIDWSEEIKSNPMLEEYIKKAAGEISGTVASNEYERPFLDMNLNLQVIGIEYIISDRDSSGSSGKTDGAKQSVID